MSGFLLDRDELRAAAARLEEAAATPWGPSDRCVAGTPVLDGLSRLLDAWRLGHAILAADADRARERVLDCLAASVSTDEVVQDRFRALLSSTDSFQGQRLAATIPGLVPEPVLAWARPQVAR